MAAAAHPGGAPHAVHEGRGVLGGVVLQHPPHIRDVQPPGRHVRAQQAACSRGTPRAWRHNCCPSQVLHTLLTDSR